MSKTPSTLKAQRSFADHGARPIDDMADRRDLATGAQSGQPGDADVNTRQQGRFRQPEAEHDATVEDAGPLSVVRAAYSVVAAGVAGVEAGA
jgi:hypothetical protein